MLRGTMRRQWTGSSAQTTGYNGSARRAAARAGNPRTAAGHAVRRALTGQIGALGEAIVQNGEAAEQSPPTSTNI